MKLLCITLVVASLLSSSSTDQARFNPSVHASSILESHVERRNVRRDSLERLRDIIFDFKDKLTFRNTDFILVLRFTKTSFKPDSQFVITKFEDGHSEIEIKALPKTLATYLTGDFPEQLLTDQQLRTIANRIPVRRTLIKQANADTERALAQFKELKLSALTNDSLPLDGTQYDLWYAVPVQTIHITQHGGVLGATSTTTQPVKWMNEMYATLIANGSVAAKLTKNPRGSMTKL